MHRRKLSNILRQVYEEALRDLQSYLGISYIISEQFFGQIFAVHLPGIGAPRGNPHQRIRRPHHNPRSMGKTAPSVVRFSIY